MITCFDLSQTIENSMTFYPNDPKPEIFPAKGLTAPWRVSELHIGSHTGTHIDAASHYVEQGWTIDQYPMERFLVSGIVVPLGGLLADQAIESIWLEPYLERLPKGGAIVIRTGWDRYWKQDLYQRHPYLAPSAAKSLASAGIGLLGIDALNVDSTFQGTTHVHATLLGMNILIVENLKGLDQLKPGEIYQFSFLPLMLRGLDGSPVRAVAWKS
jgi:kynurenine formamidase